jgi:hypothetical protein
LSIREINIYLSQASILIPLFYGVKYYKKLSKSFKWFVWFFVFASIIEVFSRLFAIWFHNNLPLSHLFTVVEFIMLIYLFKSKIHFKNNVYFSIIFLFLFSAFLDAFYWHSVFQFNSVARALESLILVCISLYFYYINIHQITTESLFKNPMFWLSTSVLIYFSVGFFYFMTKSFIEKNDNILNDLADNINAFINIISNLLFAKSFQSFKWKTS